uniref:GRAM domain-containing protein n=1 Tax=Octopus bimaculoides TaxID=37653 RepID=A0A0L8GL33_OCTBM
MLLHVPTVSKSKVAKFHKLFKSVPRSESLIDHYSCAYQGDILLQGHLYISLGWFCFYSKIRGRGRHIEIPLDNVLCVTKEKTAFIIPNAIGVQTTTEKYVFGSFVSRDAAYNLMQDLFDRYQELVRFTFCMEDGYQMTMVMIDNSGDSFAEESGISAKFNESGVAALAKSTLSMPLSKNNLSGAIIHPLIPKRKSHSESSVFCSDYSGVAETTDSEDNKLCQPGKTKTYKRTPVKATIPCVKTQFTSSTPTKPQVSQKPSSVGSSHSKKPVTVHNSWFIMPYLSQCFNCQQTYESICQLALKLLRLPKAHMVLAICAAIMIFLLVSAVTLTYKVLLIQAKLDTLQVWSPALKNLYRDKIHSDIYMMRAQSHSALVQQLHLVLEANIHVLEENLLNYLLPSCEGYGSAVTLTFHEILRDLHPNKGWKSLHYQKYVGLDIYLSWIPFQTPTTLQCGLDAFYMAPPPVKSPSNLQERVQKLGIDEGLVGAVQAMYGDAVNKRKVNKGIKGTGLSSMFLSQLRDPSLVDSWVPVSCKSIHAGVTFKSTTTL